MVQVYSVFPFIITKEKISLTLVWNFPLILQVFCRLSDYVDMACSTLFLYFPFFVQGNSWPVFCNLSREFHRRTWHCILLVICYKSWLNNKSLPELCAHRKKFLVSMLEFSHICRKKVFGKTKTLQIHWKFARCIVWNSPVNCSEKELSWFMIPCSYFVGTFCLDWLKKDYRTWKYGITMKYV